MKTKTKTKPAKGRIVCGNPCQCIEDMFRDYVKPPKDKYSDGRKFDLLVAVAGRLDSPGPRDPMWEFILEVGTGNLDKVLNREPIGPGPHFFVFPDRWLVPAEAQRFVDDLNHNPDADKFGRVYIVTHQPYIVGDCLKEEVRIIRKQAA